MVVGFTTTYAISAYHHWCCEFESRSGRRVQHYVIKLVSDLPQVGGFPRVIRFPLPIKLTGTIFITEILLKLVGVVTIYTMYLLVLDLCNTVLSSGKLWWLELHMGGAINSTGWNNPSVAPDLTSCCGIPFHIRAIALFFLSYESFYSFMHSDLVLAIESLKYMHYSCRILLSHLFDNENVSRVMSLCTCSWFRENFTYWYR